MPNQPTDIPAPTPPRSADVLVVGAGIAGLACARELSRRGIHAIVLEARDRVGGRLLNSECDGDVIELGGQFLGPGQDRVYALAAELGATTCATHRAGSNLIETGRGGLRRYRGAVPRLAPHVLLDVSAAQRRFERLARTVDPEAPWRTPGAAELDAATVATWIRRTLRTPDGRRLFTLACEAVWSCQPSELSLLHALFYARAAGSFDALISTENGAQQDHVVGGAQMLAIRMAEQLPGQVHLGSPVRRIEHSDRSVRVTTADETVWRARHIVVAVPPTLAGRIVYEPPLPPDRDALTQRLPMGSVVKCVAVYSEPFWRRHGLSGQATSLRGPLGVVYDSTPEHTGRGVLLGFVEGAAARAHARLTQERRRAAVVAQLSRLFGDRAAEPRHYVEQDWTAERWSRGGYAALFPPGVWTHLGPALRRPVGPIHWAGTETATRWCGYIDGALCSADRVVREITARLTPDGDHAVV